MNLKHLLSLLLALSMVVASCNRISTDENGYLYDEELSIATRLSSAEYDFPENHYFLNFYTSTGEKGVSVLLVGAEDETVLKAGTYTTAENNLLMDECAVFSGEDVYQCYNGEGTVVVTGDAESYSFDIELSDGKRKFHFTYSGAVEGMGETYPELPENTVYFTATSFDGMHMASHIGNIDSYMVYFSNQDSNLAQGTIYYQLSLSNVLGEVDDEGYVTIPSGTYTMGSDILTEFRIADFSNYCTVSEDGSDYEMIPFEDATLVVTETQSVLTALVEGVTHVVTFNGPLRLKADLPDPPVDFVANHAYAYYAKGVQGNEDADLFKLYLSDLGLDADGDEQAGATYYELDVFIDGLEPGAEIAIPAGTYQFDSSGDVTGVLLGGDYYKYYEDSSDIEDNDMLGDGYITINEDGTIEAVLKMVFSGATHTVTYTGDIEILENFMPTEPPYSTLTEDKECDFFDHGLLGMDNGDKYETGYQTWTLAITSNGYSGDQISFELLAGPVGESDIYGRYTVSDTLGAYTVVPGSVDGFTLMDSWYYYKPNAANITEYAPIVDGWVEFKENENGTVTVTFDVYDDLNNNITGTWTSEDGGF